jgi:hypothetical protein
MSTVMQMCEANSKVNNNDCNDGSEMLEGIDQMTQSGGFRSESIF